MAASLTQWTEFLGDLIPMTENDPSPEVRLIANQAVEACQRRLVKRWNGSYQGD